MENNTIKSILQQLENGENPTNSKSNENNKGFRMSDMVVKYGVKSDFGVRPVDEGVEPPTGK